MAGRKTIEDDTKRDIVQRLLTGKTTVQDVMRKERVHPYQVHAWVGQMVLGEGIGRKFRITPDGTRLESGTAPRSDGPLTLMLYQKITGDTDEPEDPLRAIGEWYIRSVYLVESGKPDTQKKSKS